MPRTPITSIYIVCEGKNTEPIYLERIKEEIEDENYLAITIYPDRSDKRYNSDPIGLINEAIENKSNYDEIWVVYDKDGYTKHKEAFEKLNEHKDKIRLVFSSIAFETWVLLHFERCSSAFNKSAEIINQKFIGGTNYLPTYEKKGAFDLYSLIKDKTQNAIINSAWLKYVQETNLEDNPLYEINPITYVDVLIKRLYEINEDIYFVGVQKSLIIDSIELKLSRNQHEKEIEISNHRNNSFTTNELLFYSNLDVDNLIAIDSVIISPGETHNLKFTNQNDISLKLGLNIIYFCFD